MRKSNLFKTPYLSLVTSQFFGAVNDNLLKGVLSFGVAMSGLWEGALGAGGQGYVSLCLTIPFILLSGFAGQLADRYSKRTVILGVKIAEIFIALFGLIAFWSLSPYAALMVMLLLAIQSSFFGPAKYGVIPELVEDHELSRANGMINMFTNIAIIAGTLLAGPVYQWYYPASNPEMESGTAAMLWAPGVAFLVVAVLGLIATLALPKLEARSPDLKIDWNPFGTYLRALPEMARSPLLLVALSWAFFYMIGMIALLILPDYKGMLDVSPIMAAALLAILGIAIGIGSVVAGLVSGHHIEPRLIPVGALGLTLFFFLLGVTPLSYWLVAALLMGAGTFAGLYIVPLQALLQHLSPDAERGRFIGTANALSFCCSTAGSLVFLFARRSLEMPPNRIFIVCAALALIGTGFLLWKLRRLIADPSLRKATAPQA